MEFDFELMARLAIEAPTDFARAREALIREVIDSFQTPSNGTRLQAEIDALRTSESNGAETVSAVSKRVVVLATMLSKEFKQTPPSNVDGLA